MPCKTGRKFFNDVKIPRGIFLGDALLPLQFVIVIIPLKHILRKCYESYKSTKLHEKLKHLTYMNGIKQFTKNERDTLKETIRIYSQDIGMGFVLEKCAMLMMRNERRQITERIKLSNQERIRTLVEKETYKYLGILDTNPILQDGRWKKWVSQTNEKTYLSKALLQERDKYQACPSFLILLTISGQEEKKAMRRYYIRDNIYYMSQKRKMRIRQHRR